MGSSSKTTEQKMPEFQQQFLQETMIPFAEQIASQTFKPYTGQRVQGMTDLQQQAMQGYGGLSASSPLYDQAAGAYGDLSNYQANNVTAPSQIDVDTAASRMSQYQDPYESQVVQSALRDVETGRQSAINREGAAASSARAFGGSRQALREAEVDTTANQQALDTAARLRSQGFNTALGAAQFDVGQTQAARNLAAQQALQASLANQRSGLAAGQLRAAGAAGLAGLGDTNLRNQMSILSAQMGAGEAARQIGQQGLDANYEQYMMRQNFPLTQFGVLTGAAGAIPQGYGTTTSVTRDPFGTAGNLLAGFGAFGRGFGYGQ